MKILFSALLVLLNFSFIWAQQNVNEFKTPVPVLSEKETLEFTAPKLRFIRNLPEFSRKPENPFVKNVAKFDSDWEKLPDAKTFNQKSSGEKFRWKPALAQSGIFLGIQHSFRLFQKKTRDELGGKFFKDWGKSIKNLRGWDDGDNFFTNYIAHPIQGSITGRIFVNNSERAKKEEFGRSPIYWESRVKAFVWSTLYSIQFEMGPISEATIGNVGMRQKRGYSTMAWVDLAITPTVGMAWLIVEDIFEKYVLKNWIEKKFKNKTVIKFFRILLAPTTSFGSILQGQYPWWREFRPM